MATIKQEVADTATLARLEQKLDNIDVKVDDIHKRLYGNGHPGIIVDQALQDKKIDDLLESERKNCEIIKSLIDGNPTRWLSKNWIKVVMLSILFFVLVHSLLPEGMTIWQLLSLIK